MLGAPCCLDVTWGGYRVQVASADRQQLWMLLWTWRHVPLQRVCCGVWVDSWSVEGIVERVCFLYHMAWVGRQLAMSDQSTGDLSVEFVF